MNDYLGQILIRRELLDQEVLAGAQTMADEKGVDLLDGSHVVGQREAGKPRALAAETGFSGQL